MHPECLAENGKPAKHPSLVYIIYTNKRCMTRRPSREQKTPFLRILTTNIFALNLLQVMSRREKERILFVLVDLKQLFRVVSCQCSAQLNCLGVILLQLLDRFLNITSRVSISQKHSQSRAPI
jgi:hypothetical protein